MRKLQFSSYERTVAYQGQRLGKIMKQPETKRKVTK